MLVLARNATFSLVSRLNISKKLMYFYLIVSVLLLLDSLLSQYCSKKEHLFRKLVYLPLCSFTLGENCLAAEKLAKKGRS